MLLIVSEISLVMITILPPEYAFSVLFSIYIGPFVASSVFVEFFSLAMLNIILSLAIIIIPIKTLIRTYPILHIINPVAFIHMSLFGN
jgi:hypothetical protein